MDKSRMLSLVMLGVVAMTACSPRDQDQGKAPPPDQGREETRHLKDVDGLGYSGTQIRKKVDKALDQNDQRKDQLDQAIEQQSNQ